MTEPTSNNRFERFLAPLARWQIGCLLVSLVPPMLLALFLSSLLVTGWTVRDLVYGRLLDGFVGASIPLVVCLLMAAVQHSRARQRREKKEEVDFNKPM